MSQVGIDYLGIFLQEALPMRTFSICRDGFGFDLRYYSPFTQCGAPE